MKRAIRRPVSVVLIAALLPPNVPIAVAAPPRVAEAPKPGAAGPPAANRKLPRVKPPALRPVFSETPTDQEIFRARVFEEPLVAAGPTTAAEKRALATAVERYLRQPLREDTGPLQEFLNAHPRSPWTTALLTNLGIVALRTGYVSKAREYQERAWEFGKDSADARVRALADRALADRAFLLSGLGREAELAALLDEADGRSVSGSPASRLDMARQNLWLMQNRPEEAFRCGPVALGRLLWALEQRADERVSHAPATRSGTTLVQMRDLARSAGLGLRMGRREDPQAALPVPAMVHFKTGHFATVLERAGGRYLVADPIFDEERWISGEAIDAESTGYVLAPVLPDGFRAVEEGEAGTVWGRGCPNGPDPTNQEPCDPASGGNQCGQSGQCLMMAGYTFLSMLAALRIVDTPVAYRAPRGPALDLTLTYNQRDVFQPAVFSYVNVGPKWTLRVLGYVEDDPSNPAQTAKVYMRGGGVQTYTGYDAQTQSYAVEWRSRALLVRVSANPIRYERRLPDGSVEVYAQPDGAISFPRKVFLTEERDPQGNKLAFVYDEHLRLAAIADAIGQVTSLTYSGEDPLKVTAITDPFGRSATLTYDGNGRLSTITDMIGLTSSFTYGASDFITSMTTPYGTTKFRTGQGGGRIWVESEDPLGARERVEYVQPHDPAVGPRFLPPSEVPTGFQPYNGNFDAGVTFFWDKRAMALGAGDLSKAEVMHWLEDPGTHRSQGVMRALKKPLESRIWYAFPGQQSSHGRADSRAIRVGRLLDDPDGAGPQAAPSQIQQYQYNARGNLTSYIDPVSRETVYDYDPSGLDLVGVSQRNAFGGLDLIESRAYAETDPQCTGQPPHLPCRVTNTAGQTTTFSYLPDGRPGTVVTPPRNRPDGQPLTLAERTTTYDYWPDGAATGGGQLRSVTGPSTPSGASVTSLTYDGYGRVRTTTDPDNYTITFDYDAFDRPIRTTYPDGTDEETVYNRLDVERYRDRLGRWSQTFYDALQRTVSQRDGLGRTTTLEWCPCGSLERVMDPNGNATAWERDIQGRPVREVRADGAAWEYTYEATTSRLRQRRDAKLLITLYEYDLDNNLKQVTYPNAPVVTPAVTYTYDPSHNRLATVTDGRGTTVHSYHPITTPPQLGAGRLASVDGPLADDIVRYTYDEMDRVASRGLSDFTSSFVYDALGRVARLDSPVGPFPVTYDGTTPRPLTFGYPNGQVTRYTYFANSGDRRLQEIAHEAPGGALISRYGYTYDAQSNVKTWLQQVETNAPKVYELGYDAADQLVAATLRAGGAGPVLKHYRYGYDATGNRTSEQVDDGVSSTAYNSRNQVTSTQAGGALLFAGNVNEPAAVTVQSRPADVTADNRFQGSAQVPAGTSTVSVVAQDYAQPPNVRTNTYRVTVSGTGTAYTHDANGNLTSDGVRTFEWDAENRLAVVKQGGATLAAFTYDWQGRRVAQKSATGIGRSFVYDDDDILEERLTTGQTLRYVHGPGIDKPLARQDGSGAVIYYLADHLGSIVQMTDDVGAVMMTREYDTWGNPLQGGETRGYAFTGREWDSETGLAYYRARYYDPKIGRFLSEDPIGLAGGLDRYAYVLNNPAKYIDPTGEFVWIAVLVGIGFAASMAVPAVTNAPATPNTPLAPTGQARQYGAAAAAMASAAAMRAGLPIKPPVPDPGSQPPNPKRPFDPDATQAWCQNIPPPPGLGGKHPMGPGFTYCYYLCNNGVILLQILPGSQDCDEWIQCPD